MMRLVTSNTHCVTPAKAGVQLFKRRVFRAQDCAPLDSGLRRKDDGDQPVPISTSPARMALRGRRR